MMIDTDQGKVLEYFQKELKSLGLSSILNYDPEDYYLYIENLLLEVYVKDDNLIIVNTKVIPRKKILLPLSDPNCFEKVIKIIQERKQQLMKRYGKKFILGE